MADAIETTMCEAGYRKNTEAIRPVNEARFEARWRLGQLLAKAERRPGARSDLVSARDEVGFRNYLRKLGLNKDRANECERIAAIPEDKLRMERDAADALAWIAARSAREGAAVIPLPGQDAWPKRCCGCVAPRSIRRRS